MFTGIIEKIGRVTRVSPQAQGMSVEIETGFADLTPGESVAVNGVCLTAAEFPGPTSAVFFLSTETLSRTAFSELKPGSSVNLERALPAQGRLSGHFVQGHVDGRARTLSIEPSGECFSLRVTLSSELAKYCVEKGSIALNGVSLTINGLEEGPGASQTVLSIMLVPHTVQHTTFQTLKAGDWVHVENDILAKYTERLCRQSR